MTHFNPLDVNHNPKLLNNASTVFTACFLASLPYCIDQSPSYQVRHTETQCCAANDSSRVELLPQRLFSPLRQHEVQGRPRGASPGCVYFVVVKIQVRAEEKNGCKKQGKDLWRTKVLGGDESGKHGRRSRRFWRWESVWFASESSSTSITSPGSCIRDHRSFGLLFNLLHAFVRHCLLRNLSRVSCATVSAHPYIQLFQLLCYRVSQGYQGIKVRIMTDFTKSQDLLSKKLS